MIPLFDFQSVAQVALYKTDQKRNNVYEIITIIVVSNSELGAEYLVQHGFHHSN